MVLFLILAPFAAFGLLMLIATPLIGLGVGAAVALVTIGYDVKQGKSVKLLAAGAAVLFAAIGGHLAFGGQWTKHDISLAIDLGVLALALGSIVCHLPFTLQYARETVTPEIMQRPAFLRTNYILSWAWVGALMLMLAADIAMIYAPGLPLWVGIGIAFAARNSAVYFTKWYPAHRRAKLAAQSG